ncbi:hypothetical protein ACVIJ6_000465 [Bradyrhizobium sp. USDA 4369]
MSTSVKGLLAIVVALIAMACFASSELKLYLGLLVISLLVSFAVVGLVAWLIEAIVRQRDASIKRRLASVRSVLAEDAVPLPMTSADQAAPPTPRGG